MANIAKENKSKNRIENNIVISGIEINLADNQTQKEKEDEEKVEQILGSLGLGKETIEKQSLIKLKDRINSTVPTWKDSKMIRIEFKESKHKILALKNAKNLRTESELENYYVNPELTEIERSIEKQLRDERNKRNAALPNLEDNGRLRYGIDNRDKKYYWVIRGSQLRQIPITE